MKTLLSLLGILLILFSACHSQTIKAAPIDTILSRLEKQLPSGWNMIQMDTQLTLKRKETVWILAENRINAPIDMESIADRNQRIQTRGQKGVTQMVYTLEPRWTSAKIDKSKDLNKQIHQAIQALPETLNISHLYNQILSSKGTPTYTAKTESDKASIKQYQAEKERLEKQLIKLPDHHSQFYSLFHKSSSGYEDDLNLIYPQEASKEWYQIRNLLKDLLE